MTDATADTATKGGDAAKDQTKPDKTEPKAKAKASGVGFADTVKETEPLKMNEAGQQLHSDGLPLARVARAKALAAAGKTTDPEGIVPDDIIGAYDPKAKEADREAVAQFHEEQAEAARKAAAKEAEEATANAQKGE